MNLTPGWQPHPYLAGNIPGWTQRDDIQPLTLSFDGIPIATTHQTQAQPGEAIITASKVSGLHSVTQRVETSKVLPYGDLAGDIGWAERAITIEGKLIGSYELGDGAIRRLLDRLLSIDQGVLRAREPGLTDRWCVARVSQLQCNIEARQTKASPREVWVPYQLTLVADDPLWYSHRTLSIDTRASAAPVSWKRWGNRPPSPLAWWRGTGTAVITHGEGTLSITLGSKSASEVWAADFRTFGLFRCPAPKAGEPLYSAGGVRHDGSWKGKWPNMQNSNAGWSYKGPAVTLGRIDAWL